MGSTVDTGYFSQVQEQFSLRVSEPIKGVASGYESSAKAGVSAPVNAFDSMVKGGMVLASIPDGLIGAAVVPLLSKFNLTGMVSLPVARQTNPILGIDIHMVLPGAIPVPYPFIGISFNPLDFIAASVASLITAPPLPTSLPGEARPAFLLKERLEAY